MKDLFQRNSQRTTKIIICTVIFVVVLSFAVILYIFCSSLCTESHKKSKLLEKVKKNPSAVLSLAVLSFIANIYIIFLAGTALGFWRHRGEDELRHIFHDFDEKRNLGPLIFVLIIDLICLVVWGLVVFKSVCTYFKIKPLHVLIDTLNWLCCRTLMCTCPCNLCRSTIDHDDYIPILSLTVLCPIFCIIAHSPYIAIAYLDDGSHASSIFIYYSILGYVLFGLLWLFFHWYENFEKGLNKFELNLHVSDLRTITVAILILVIFTFLGLIATISCYFVLIPINKSISDAPNRIFSIYESGGFIIGSFIVYKIFEFFYVKKKKDITIEHTHKLLQERLPHPLQQQFHKLQQQYNQLQLELQLTPGPQNSEPQNQLKTLQKQCYEHRLQNLHQIEQQLSQSEQEQRQPHHHQQQGQQLQQLQGQPQVDDNQTQQQTLRDLQQQLHGIQQNLYQILFPSDNNSSEPNHAANGDQRNENEIEASEYHDCE